MLIPDRSNATMCIIWVIQLYVPISTFSLLKLYLLWNAYIHKIPTYFRGLTHSWPCLSTCYREHPCSGYKAPGETPETCGVNVESVWRRLGPLFVAVVCSAGTSFQKGKIFGVDASPVTKRQPQSSDVVGGTITHKSPGWRRTDTEKNKRISHEAGGKLISLLSLHVSCWNNRPPTKAGHITCQSTGVVTLPCELERIHHPQDLRNCLLWCRAVTVINT